MYIADLHIHSRYSRATSKDCTPEYLDLWARRKGIHLVGTGDFTHPAWREELREKLIPAEEGLYLLKEEYRLRDGVTDDSAKPRFVITGEISSIYKKYDKVRKVHSLLLLPSLEEAEIVSQRLETIGNIHSDGRPILGLDCHDLLEIMLELCPEAVYVPAHIWTPHFSLFGAFSGFDTIEECFGDLTPYIHALETGLSSDPPMIWRISALDSYQLISNSDAHSPSKLGREANLLDIQLSYSALAAAIQTGKGLHGTIEFFPEEGKYHYDGHRKCHLCLSPSQAFKYEGKCPICGKKLTIGVSHRIEELADREEGFVLGTGRPFESLVPLPEVIAASTGRSAAGVKVQSQYKEMLRGLGDEFSILRDVPLEDIKRNSGSLIAEGIRRLRRGQVMREPGFDGEYGTIRLLEPWEIDDLDGQLNFFSAAELAESSTASAKEKEAESAAGQTGPADVELAAGASAAVHEMSVTAEPMPAVQLSAGQQEAVRLTSRAMAVIAGPGTGKTRTLVSRIMYLINERGVKPSEITAVTFTNKAAAEMRERLEAQMGGKRAVRQLRIGTFHSICFQLMRKQGRSFTLADEEIAGELAAETLKQFGLPVKAGQFLQQVSQVKSGVRRLSDTDAKFEQAFSYYQELLKKEAALDFDDLLTEVLALKPEKVPFLLVDEFQDVNSLQYQLIRAWSQSGRELFVIGDPDQAIYSFRGSNDRSFDRLGEDFPGLVTLRLDENYRSCQPVLGGALAVISENPGETRILNARKMGGSPIRIVTAASEMSEGIFAAREINRLIGGIDMLDAQDHLDRQDTGGRGRYSFSDVALLFRTHRQEELLELCLQKEGIPYLVVGRGDFLAERTVRGTICFFKTLLELGNQTLQRLCLKLLWNDPEEETAKGRFTSLQETYRPMLARKKPQKIVEAWIRELGFEKDKPMEKFLGSARAYRTMREFLDSLTLGGEGDLQRCGGKVYTSDAVTLMTLHGAKGLEFPVVMICGVKKGLIPFEAKGPKKGDANEERSQEVSAKGGNEEEKYKEEERRLLYVGMTRAEDELLLITSGQESEFLSCLPQCYVEREKADKRKNSDSGVQMRFDFL